MKRDSEILMRPRANTCRELLAAGPLRARLFLKARTLVRSVQSFSRRISTSREWICFPYYHFVMDDERRNFDRQLTYWSRFAQFISLDDVGDALQNPAGIGGLYICITFDDGLKNCVTNALPILVGHRCPAAFFIPTDYIGLDLDRDWNACSHFYMHAPTYWLPLEFLSWDDCRRMRAAGMTIGSHTCSHRRLVELTPAQAEREIVASKARIEEELGAPCDHFAAPWGRPGADFDADRDTATVRRAGYRSLLTTSAGLNLVGSDPYSIRRKNFLAGDGPPLVRYFLSRNA